MIKLLEGTDTKVSQTLIQAQKMKSEISYLMNLLENTESQKEGAFKQVSKMKLEIDYMMTLLQNASAAPAPVSAPVA